MSDVPAPAASERSERPSAAQTRAVLDQWIAEGAAGEAQAGGVGAGSIALAQWAARTGLEQLQAVVAGQAPLAPIAKTLDFSLIRVGLGMALLQGTPGPAHLNPMGSIHGGWFATLLDAALGCAVHTTMPIGRGFTTAELHVNFVRSLMPRVERVRVEGKLIHGGRQMATAEARMFGPDGTLYAHGTATCLVFDLPPPR